MYIFHGFDGYIYLKRCKIIQIKCGLQGREKSGSASQVPTPSPSTFSPSPASFASEFPDSSFVISESYEVYNNNSSPNSVEISSNQIVNKHAMNQSEERANEASSSSGPDINWALRRIEQQLSLNDDEVKKFNEYYFENEDSNDLDVLREYEYSGQTPNGTADILPLQSGIYRFLMF